MPAAAVIRGWQTLSGFTGRKEMRRRFVKSFVKDLSLPEGVQEILAELRKSGESRIHRGLVKWVDTVKNIYGVGSSLGLF